MSLSFRPKFKKFRLKIIQLVILLLLLTACGDGATTALPAPNSPLAVVSPTLAVTPFPTVATVVQTPTPISSPSSTISAITPIGKATANSSGRATLGGPFQLKFHQNTLLEAENLAVEFTTLVSDSRCPRNVNCVVAGSVTVVVKLEKGSAASELELTLPGLTQNKQIKIFNGYSLELQAVDPYPGANATNRIGSGASIPTISPADYTITLIIRKV